MKRFQDLPLKAESIRVLSDLGIDACTSVQEQSIEPMLQGSDLIVQAPTGTGKTYAYSLPLIERCQPERAEVQALILAPTRELVQQIDHEVAQLITPTEGLRSLAIFGGEGMRRQIDALKTPPQIVIATPGRLIDHLRQRRLRLDQVRVLVLDEADRMLDMGFVDDVRFIMDKVPKSAQIGLFSATLSREVLDISWIYQKAPREIVVAAVEENKPDIRQYVVKANGPERILAIRDIMAREECERALVFVNMKQSADITAEKLRREGFLAGSLQGDMAQRQRNRVMRDFREGDLKILVGTDVAARGLDIDDVDVVFNYDLPIETENYIHRIGRTGRARRRGLAFSFIVPGTETAFAQFCRKLRISVEDYAWAPPLQEERPISSAREAEVIERIRSKSQWLRRDEAERYDPLAGARSPRGRQGGRRPSSSGRKPDRQGGQPRRGGGHSRGQR